MTPCQYERYICRFNRFEQLGKSAKPTCVWSVFSCLFFLDNTLQLVIFFATYQCSHKKHRSVYLCARHLSMCTELITALLMFVWQCLSWLTDCYISDNVSRHSAPNPYSKLLPQNVCQYSRTCLETTPSQQNWSLKTGGLS